MQIASPSFSPFQSKSLPLEPDGKGARQLSDDRDVRRASRPRRSDAKPPRNTFSLLRLSLSGCLLRGHSGNVPTACSRTSQIYSRVCKVPGSVNAWKGIRKIKILRVSGGGGVFVIASQSKLQQKTETSARLERMEIERRPGHLGFEAGTRPGLCISKENK